VKKPGENNLYYLFTINNTLFPVTFGLYYSLIDMSLNGGLGDIVPGFKNIAVSGTEDVLCGIHGTRHHNNQDVWIIVRKFSSNQYASYRITSTGISATPVLSSCSLPGCDGYFCGNNIMKISQDGTRYVFVSHDPVQNIDIAELGIFNPQTGVLSPLFQFRPVNLVSENPLYFEFSPNSKFLYVVSSFTTEERLVFQYDMAFSDSAQFMQSQILIASPHVGLALQLGPDGKIYQCVANLDSLNVIHNPNVNGLGCNFQSNAISLASGTFNHSGLPQFLQRYKAYLHFNGSGCESDSLHFSGDIWPPADTIRWNFGDPASGAANVSYLASSSHLYSAPGAYTVELYVRHNDNRTDTTWRTVTILPSPQPGLGPDKTICNGNSVTFDAGFCAGCTYEWKNVGSGLIVGTNQTFPTGTSGIYCVNVTNGNGCTGKDTVQLFTTPVPVVTNNPPLLKSICTGESTNIPLFGNEPGIMFHWTATLTSGNVTGFTADSGLVINQILINNGATAGVVTYHITPKIGDCA
ncbi:MAG: PKD domain-containing protein, partial [Bacteroidota bacterium]